MFVSVLSKRIHNKVRVTHYTKYASRYLSSEPLTKVTFENGIQNITLCNQKTRNALSMAMMTDLLGQINKHSNDKNLRAIVLSAEGPVFSAGHNLKELTQETGPRQHKKIFKVCSELMNSIIDSPVPVIAKVDGFATAAGCQLVAQCDMAVCTEESKFSTPGANFGIFCSTPGIPLARCVPKMTAMHMLLTGLPISSSEAKESGLVSKVCKKEDLDKVVDEICHAISSKSRSVIHLGKHFYYKQIQEDIRKAYDMGSEIMVDNVNMADGKEGIRSFVEKRKAVWSHTFDF